MVLPGAVALDFCSARKLRNDAVCCHQHLYYIWNLVQYHISADSRVHRRRGPISELEAFTSTEIQRVMAVFVEDVQLFHCENSYRHATLGFLLLQLLRVPSSANAFEPTDGLKR